MNVVSKLTELLSDTIQYYNDRPPSQHITYQPDNFVSDIHSQCGDNTVNEELNESVNHDKINYDDKDDDDDDNEVDTEVDSVIKGVDDHVGLGAGSEHTGMESIDSGQVNDTDDDTSENIIPNTSVFSVDNKGDNAGSVAQNGNDKLKACIEARPAGDSEQVDGVKDETCVKLLPKLCNNACEDENIRENDDFTCTCEKVSLKTDEEDDEVVAGAANRFTCNYVKSGSPVLEELSRQVSKCFNIIIGH